MDKFITMSIEDFQGYVDNLSFEELRDLRERVFSEYEEYGFNSDAADINFGDFKHNDTTADKYRVFLGIVENKMAEKNETPQM